VTKEALSKISKIDKLQEKLNKHYERLRKTVKSKRKNAPGFGTIFIAPPMSEFKICPRYRMQG
jgi:hypothetical protein